MRKKNLVTAVLVASMLVGSVGVTSTPVEAKSKKSREIKVSTVVIKNDSKATARKVMNTLNKGKAVNFKVKGSKKSAAKLMKKVSLKVGELNKYDVLPQYSSSKKCKSNKKYRIYSVSKYEAQTYKYGLLLVKDIVTSLRKFHTEAREERREYKETLLRNQYTKPNQGVGIYESIFEEVTGMSYEKWEYGQKAKTKTPILFKVYDSNKKTWEFEKDWYYMTYQRDGKIHYNVSNSHFEYDESLGYEGDTANPKNYIVEYWDMWTNGNVRIPYAEVTVHYEPLKVDTDKINQIANSRLSAELTKLREELAKEPKDPILCKDFKDLSQALQQSYLSQAFGDGDGLLGKEWMRYSTTICVGGAGLSGIKAMLKQKWIGKCMHYARMELTMYELFGIKNYRYFSCKKCDHAWSAVQVTNSKGKKGWVRNDYGIDYNEGAYTTVKGCACNEHQGGGSPYTHKWKIKNFFN